MTDATVVVDSGTGPRSVELSAYVDASVEEAAAVESLAWIKRVRHARVDGQPFRARFTFRGDSLWWFAELYLHKQQVVLEIFRTVLALERLIAREHPLELRVTRGGRIVRQLAPQLAAARRVRYSGPRPRRWIARARIATMNARASWLHASALAGRLGRRVPPRRATAPAAVAAFLHRAFWRADIEDGSGESYVGPILQVLESRLGAAELQYVSVGPSMNFRARRWWDPIRARTGSSPVTPVELFAPLARLGDSRAIWRRRQAFRRALWASADLREASVIHGCDCWLLIREELAGIALLQWPWSTRIMDEAAAVLDEIRPRVVVTYAEAGGWGRALVLESRRRRIPTVGLQHGFIYRHWLNYLHEPDEMADASGDGGFPRPSLTLLFDRHAERHLIDRGRFPRESLVVTGSPRLDELVAACRQLSPADLERARSDAGVEPSASLVLVATKYREARQALPALLDAAQQIPGVHVAIKTHPAETPAVYEAVTAGRACVSVLPAATPLAPLLRVCRAIVTVNSTVALDAAVLQVPALVIGLPNNLSPFVEAGVMAGGEPADLGRRLAQILYDEEFRNHLSRVGREFLLSFSITSDGRAAERAVDAVLRLAADPMRH